MAAHQFIIRLANEQDIHHVNTISKAIKASAEAKGAGLCKRSPTQLAQRIREGAAVIATTVNGKWVGFCYIKSWDAGRFVSTCALIVTTQYRNSNVATRLKEKAFALAQKKYPSANLFGLTTSRAVMKINTRLGFVPVTYSEVAKDDAFWDACKSCPNYDVLTSKKRSACLCTAMLFKAVEEAMSLNGQRSGASQRDETSLQKKLSAIEVFG